MECFPLIDGRNGLKSGINRHLLSVGYFKTNFVYALFFCTSFLCDSILHSGCSALHGMNLIFFFKKTYSESRCFFDQVFRWEWVLVVFS